MTRLISASECQARGVGVGLAAVTLEATIDQEEAELVRRCGAHAGAVTEDLEPRCGAESIYLSRPAASVASITEYQFLGDPAPLTRDAGGYVLFGAQGRIARGAASLPWGRLVRVAYTPADDLALRKSVLLELVRVATEQTAAAGGSETISADGSSVTFAQGTAANWRTAREAQYGRLGWLS